MFIQIAGKLGLQDHPTGRSSHHRPTVTGAGVIFVISFICYLFWQTDYTLPGGFVLGFFLLTSISFLDDLFFLKHSLRLVCQIVAACFLVYELPFQSSGIELVALSAAAVIFGVGVLNAYNFMDGINGMLTLHALLLFACFYYLNGNITGANGEVIYFTDHNFILALAVPTVIFGFLNVRKHALAFMGDVGSIGIAFSVLYLMYSLILSTGNYSYLLMFSIFGADAALTVCYKLLLNENIFIPHRDFLFKKLVHLAKWSHLRVSFYYLIAQTVINLVVIIAFPKAPKMSTQISVLFIGCIALIAFYIYMQSKFPIKRKKTGLQYEQADEQKEGSLKIE
jgi:UDP-N-acetylmuramyl pentapeptide phosphotransferase/UDP-N-acetylglucosamine-1-phosphate transferase